MKWSDINEIVEELIEKFPETNPEKILFVDLFEKVINLSTFDDEPKHCGERILEAIQQKWIEEVG